MIILIVEELKTVAKVCEFSNSCFCLYFTFPVCVLAVCTDDPVIFKPQAGRIGLGGTGGGKEVITRSKTTFL